MNAKLRSLPTARVLASPLTVGVLAALAGVLTLAVVRTATERIALSASVHRTQKEIAQLKADQTRLSVLVARLRSPQALESDARLRLNLAKPGETLAVLSEPSTPTAAVSLSLRSVPSRWFEYFFTPKS